MRKMNLLMTFFVIFIGFCAWFADAAADIHEQTRMSKRLLAFHGISVSDLAEGDYVQLEHDVVFAVKQLHLDEVERKLMEVSSPSSSKYGKHWTKSQVDDLVSNPAGVKSVLDFLNSHATSGVRILSTTHNSLYITARAPLATWESLLTTKFQVVSLTEDCNGNKLSNPLSTFRAKSYSLPFELIDNVKGILRVVDTPFSKERYQCRAAHPRAVSHEPETVGSVRSKLAVTFGSTPSDQLPQFVTPSLLNEFYDIFTNDGLNLGSQCIFESLGQNMSVADLSMFQTFFNLPIQSLAADIGGGVIEEHCTDPNGCIEANLDTQYIMGLAQNVPTTLWYDGNETELFLDWIIQLENSENPPLVNSISYCEYEDTVSYTELDGFNSEAMKLGLRGVSLLAASGDWGITGYLNDAADCGYYSLYPASSPFVTSVGGTQGRVEVACQSDKGGKITTGGGFSNYYTAPDYQKNNVKQYFMETTPYQDSSVANQFFNASNRGYPDISSLAAYYSVVIGGKLYLTTAGTSASTPVIAAMLSLVNSARIAKSLSPMGFLNPFLYESSSQQFINDIIIGNNSCLEQSGSSVVCCSPQGYTAQSGWDPVTGLGSLNFRGFYNSAVGTDGDDDDYMNEVQDAAVGIAIAVVIVFFLGAVLFVFEVPMPWHKKNKTVEIVENDGDGSAKISMSRQSVQQINNAIGGDSSTLNKPLI
jgi:tripeptidyl-peptidase I